MRSIVTSLRQVITVPAVVLAATVFATGTAAAQQVHTIRGVVFDSVAGKPLAGAVVQLASPSSNAAPHAATTDPAGRFDINGLTAGRYVIGFYSDALTAVGLDAPSRTVDVGADSVVVVDLAIPSSETIRSLRCGLREPFRQGMLVGFVRDAESRGAVAGAHAVVQWRAMALDSANYHVVDEARNAAIEPDGALLVCGLPVDAPLELRVTAPGHQTLDGTVVNVPASAIVRLDMLLVDSAMTNGTAIIRGRVVRENGRAVNSGRVAIKSLARDVPIRDGAFSAGGLPAGSWIAQARVIGVEPQDVLVTASDSAVTATTITVSDAPQLLDAVTVVGTPDRNLRVLDEVLRRKRIGSGTTFLPGHPALRSALFVSDVMKEARGFLYQGPNKILGRAMGNGQRCPFVAVYVDGIRQPDGFLNLEGVAPLREVLAIETWPDIAFAPVEYRLGTVATPMDAYRRSDAARPNTSACALVLVWTKRPF